MWESSLPWITTGQQFIHAQACLTVDGLNAALVVGVELVVSVVARVVGRHEGRRHAGVAQAEGVAELVGSHDLQVGAPVLPHRPHLVVVEVRVSGQGLAAWEERVGQRAPCG